MKRRKALKTLGALLICLGGHPVMAKAEDLLKATPDNVLDTLQRPMDYVFDADNIDNLIIQRKGKPDIVIPFCEIVEALER